MSPNGRVCITVVIGEVGTKCLGNRCQKYIGSTKEYSVNGNVWDGDDDDPGCGQEPPEAREADGEGMDGWMCDKRRRGRDWLRGQLECSDAMQGADAWSNENCSRGAGVSVKSKRLAVPSPPCVWKISRLPVNGEVGQTAVSKELIAAD